MKHRYLILAAMLAAFPLLALAEEGADDARAPRVAAAGPGDFHVGMWNGMVATQVGVTPITNAPYSGLSVTERRQALADGNQIATRRSFMAYRDSAGRTRLENMNDKGELESVQIHDPVAGFNWALDPRTHSAVKTSTRRTPAVRMTREQIDKMRKEDGWPFAERRQGADGRQEIVIKGVERLDPETSKRFQEQVRIQAQAASRVPRVERANIASSLASAFGDAQWAAQATTRDLGVREFNGVKANGRLRSYEIPAGAIGNRNAIQVATETWTSPELQVTLYTRHSDPRSGEVEFRLENLKRDEPAASLFAAPSDYTVKEP